MSIPLTSPKVWPRKDYRLIEIGEMVLDRNPENCFAELQHSNLRTLCLAWGTSPDKMLQARLISYLDAYRYRLGANYGALPSTGTMSVPYVSPGWRYALRRQLRLSAELRAQQL